MQGVEDTGPGRGVTHVTGRFDDRERFTGCCARRCLQIGTARPDGEPRLSDPLVQPDDQRNQGHHDASNDADRGSPRAQ